TRQGMNHRIAHRLPRESKTTSRTAFECADGDHPSLVRGRSPLRLATADKSPRFELIEDEPPPPEHRLIGRSTLIRTLRRQLERLAKLPLPVLIHGETGTGKELAARTLHDFGEHRTGPFVALNCGAIPDG